MITFLNRLHRAINASAPDVFVLGNQKSGTTVIAAALAECAGAPVALDLHAIHTRRATDKYISRSLSAHQIARRCRWDFSARIVKEPILTFYVKELLDTYSESRFVFIVRDPRDNIRSILNRLELPGHQDSLSDCQRQKLSPAWREVIENRRLGFGFDNYVQSLACRWLYAWRLISGLGERVVTVRYEDFVADKAGSICRLTGRLGFQPNAHNLDVVNRQFQGRGQRNVSWPKFFGANLELINDTCRSAMQELAYARDMCSSPVAKKPCSTALRSAYA